jgi:hypothetical protein
MHISAANVVLPVKSFFIPKVSLGTLRAANSLFLRYSISSNGGIV